jgi:hypothetical protein
MTELTRSEAQALIDKYALKVKRPDPSSRRKII